MGKISYKVRRYLAMLLAIVMTLTNINLSGVFAAPVDDWTHTGGIRYLVTKAENELGEEITLEAEGEDPSVTVTGIELPDGSIEEAADGYAYAVFQAESNGTYDFRILVTRTEPATPSDATASDAEKIATPSYADSEEDGNNIEETEQEELTEATPSDADMAEDEVSEPKETLASAAATYVADTDVTDWHVLFDTIQKSLSAKKASPSEAEKEEMAENKTEESVELDEEDEDDIPDMDLIDDVNPAEEYTELFEDYIPLSVSVQSIASDATCTIEWQDGYGDKLADDLVYPDDTSVVYFKLDYALSGSGTYPAGALEMKIPDGKYLLPTKDGGYIDGSESGESPLMIATGDNGSYSRIAEERQTIYGTSWDAYLDGEDVILVNNAEIQAGSYTFGSTLRYDIVTFGTEIKDKVADMAKRNILVELYENEVKTNESNRLTFTINTDINPKKVRLSGTEKSWYKWSDDWGEVSAQYPADQYVYAVYNFGLSLSASANQYALFDTASYTAAGGTVIAYTVTDNSADAPTKPISGFADEIATLKGEKLNQDKFNHYFVFLVSYPRSDSSTWDSGLSMSMEATVSPEGGIDNAVTVSDSANANFKKFTYPSDSFSASGSANSGTQDNLCLTYLNEDEPISKSYRLKSNGYVHALRTQKGNLSAMFGLGNVTLDGTQLIAGEDYTFTDLSASASVSVYAEDQYGSVSQKFLNDAATYQYKVYGSDEWITADSSYFYDSTKNITDVRMLLDGSQTFDYLSVTLTPSFKIYPTEHIKSIIAGKSSAVLAVSDQFSVTDAAGTEQVPESYRSYTVSRTLSGASITTRPYVAYGFEGTSKDNDRIYGRAMVYMRTNPSVRVKKYALTESEVYFTVPSELTVSNFTAYDSTNDQTLDISDVYKIGRTDDGDAIYRATMDFAGVTTYDAYIQYEWSCSVDELNESNRLDFFPDAKAFWMRADGGDLYYNADGSGTVYMHSGASYVVRNGKNYPTTQDDLSAVQIGYSSTVYDFSLFEGMDPDHPDAQVCVANGSGYYGTTAPSYESGYSLTVKSDSSTGFSDTATNDLSGVYAYRLKLTTGSGKTYDHILFYDRLEEAGSLSGLPTKGTLLSVDTSAAAKKSGCTPVVYYYTGDSTDVATKDDLTGTGWTTTMPADKTTVKAVAVYFGDDYTLSANNKLYVDILMQAPSTYNKQWETDYASLEAQNQSSCMTGTAQTGLKSGITSVTVEPEIEISLATTPAGGTKDQPATVINGQLVEHVITVTNKGTAGVGNLVVRDIVGDSRMSFTDRAIYVSMDGGGFKKLSDIGGKAVLDKSGYDITIPGLNAGSTCQVKVQTMETIGDGTSKEPVENQASVISVAGSTYEVASEKLYLLPKKAGFSAGYGIGLSWTVKNEGNKSVYEKSGFSMTGIPAGTVMEIYRKADCTEIASGIYKPLAGMTPIATLTNENSFADLYPWMMKESDTEKEKDSILSGSIEQDGESDSTKYSVVLYCKSGSMEDTSYEVYVTSNAAQSRNNRFDGTWHGFTSTKSVQLIGVKGVNKKTVHYDANGGYFGNDGTNTINDVSYVLKEGVEMTKTSKTSNVNEDGSSYSGGYGNNQAITDTVTIPGAEKLNVKITYQTESTSYDWVCVYEGNDIVPSASNYSQSKSGKLGGSTKTTKTFTITGDTVKFFFRSDGTSDKYFGYYAVVTGAGTGYEIHNGSYAEPQKDGEKFAGWYTDDSEEFDLNGFVISEQKETTVYAKWAERYGTLKTGQEINESVKKLINPSSTYSSDDTTVTAFLKSETPPASTENTVLLSADDSDEPVIAWYDADSNSVYWYCKTKVKTQSDLSSLFYKFKNITDVSGVSEWDTSGMQNASSMFYACYALENVDALSDWNTSNLTKSSSMFDYCKKLTNLDGLSNWDTSNLTNISSMFDSCSALTECRSLKDWNTSNLTSMLNTFNSCYNLTLLDLSNWNLSKVSNMNVGASFSNAAYTSKACTIICTKEVEDKLNNTNSGMTTSYFTFVRPTS